ncbi:MAG: TolC family protein [Bacteroidota bacterium]
MKFPIKRLSTLAILLCGIPWMLAAQETSPLSLQDLFVLIKSNHPVAKQINLLSDRAKENLRIARGGFDPKLYGEYDDKFFDDKNYWRTFEGGLKVPTRLPLDIKSGFAWNDGSYLNPKQSLPAHGQLSLGANLSVGQGLMMDARRASLRKAKIFQELAEVEQFRMLNDLLFEAATAYWQWSRDYSRQQVLEDAVEAASGRFDAIRSMYLAGDQAGIDTTEALTQLLSFQLRLQEINIELQTSRLQLSNYLWNDENLPLQLTDDIIPLQLEEVMIPSDLAIDSLERLLDRIEMHPEVQQLNFQQSTLEVERRVKREKLKPVIDLEYSLLSPPNTLSPEGIGDGGLELGHNTKWGVSVGFPLFLRKERGELNLNKIKMQETAWKQEQKRLQTRNKILAYAQEFRILRDQVMISQEAVENYQRLLDGEEMKLQMGESTIFYINTREIKLLETQMKLLDLMFKLLKSEAGLLWASGTPLAN